MGISVITKVGIARRIDLKTGADKGCMGRPHVIGGTKIQFTFQGLTHYTNRLGEMMA